MGNVPMRRGGGLIQKHSEYVERIDAMRVKVATCYGRILIPGAGEVAVDLPFPFVFSERPIFTYGGELDVNHRARAGAYPTVSGVIVDWDERGARLGQPGRFHGATVAVVTTGLAAQNMWFHYRFEGRALRNPLNTVGSTDETV